MWTLLFLCSVLTTHGVQAGVGRYYTAYSTPAPTQTGQTAQPSCRYNCGRHMGSCSCSSSCRYNGNCCHDYYSYCPTTTHYPHYTTSQPSCRNNCGYSMGSCSCSSSCRYNGNCCHDYYSYCSSTTHWPYTTGQPSCRYNCGRHMGSCSCSSSCRYNGNCCHDYYSYCPTTTHYPHYTTSQPSCRYNCGYSMGSCSCSSSCRYNGNCCHDYNRYCYSTTYAPVTARPSCRYNCGRYMGSCSCSSSCRYNGNCCHDYYTYCQTTTHYPHYTTSQPSCRYNCGYSMGSCSCSSSCRYNGNCCHDYNQYCYSTTYAPVTARPSCRYNCGRHMGSCSCYSSCRYNGNCCHDYYTYCPTTTHYPHYTTSQPSCRNNCGYSMGSCSCSSSCRYNGNCCHDYYSYCSSTTHWPYTTAKSCGGMLFGSGTFSSDNHPGHYQDHTYCIWQLKASYDQRIFLRFSFVELENCCSCDYISVYDGSSTSSRLLGKVCNNSVSSFYSSYQYMTVVFRTDGSVVARGFSAEFMSSLRSDSGRVECSSENMNIAISRSYLSSLGYDGNNLYLNDPNCRPYYNSRYEWVFRYPLNSCGNVKTINNGTVIYTNHVRAYNSSYSGEITRQTHFELSVHCRMEQDSVSQIMYIVNHPGNSSIIGTGRYNTSMDFYTSSNFYYKVTENPYRVSLNQYLYVEVDLWTPNSGLVIFLDTCVTSPSPNDFTSRIYYLVRNGCPADSTFGIYVSGTRTYARFRFKAFQFLHASPSVYIQCKVLICPNSSTSRCRRGCMRRAARDLGSDHDSQTLVLGPIQLKDPEKKEEGNDEQSKA